MATESSARSDKNWTRAIASWCENARRRIPRGTFTARPDCKKLLRIATSTPMSERLESLRLAHDALESTATAVYEARHYGRKMQPKLVKYYAFTTIARQNWIRGEYLQWIIQWTYTLLAGRMLTPLGPLRFYAFIAAVGTLFFAPLYAIQGGIEWTLGCDSSPSIEWYHYIYFSGLTLTTLGYGDLHPTDAPRCIIAIIQAILGYLVLGLGVFVVAQYVTLYTPEPTVPNLDDFITNRKDLHLGGAGEG